MEIIHGVPCIKGEIHSLITLMRLNTRWSTRGSARRSSRENPNYEDEDKLIQSFRRLNEYLEGLFDLHEVDCVNYIKPFHDVIISLDANGQLTSAALSALSKFALYGFFNTRFPNIKAAMSLVADCIAHCEFEETDWESDELILMKLLELSALCFRCNAADELTVHSAWEIYCTCISIHNHYRASKILRSEAETALVHLTLSIFNRANSLTTRLRALSILAPNDSVVSLEITMGEYTQDTLLSSQTGLVVMLLKVMRVLAEMLEAPKQTPEHIKFSLFLINVALEAGGTALNYIPSVVTLLSDDICRHLLRSSQSDDLGVFSSSLRVVFNLFMSIKDHMKVQLEVFLSSVHLRLLSMNNSSAAAKEELVLESLLDFCREPSLMQDLYANYDCDVQCSNLFDSIIETLCKKVLMNVEDEGSGESGKERKLDGVDSVVSRAQAVSRLQEGLLTPKHLSIIHRLTFDGIIAVLHAVVGKFDLLHYSDYRLRTDSNGDVTEENVESQVDKWCDMGPEYECMSVDDFEVLQYADSGAPSSPQVQKVTSNSPFVFVKDNQSVTSEEGDGTSQSSVTSLVDKENELTGAMLEARQKAIETLRQRKMMKQKLRWIVEEFNQRPVKTEWLKYAVDAGIVALVKGEESLTKPTGTVSNNAVTDICSVADPHSTAVFLKSTSGLGKAQIGEFISKGPVHLYPFNQKVLREYLGTFDFQGEHGAFDKAMRLFLSAFRLPGEAQCIDRIMEAFAARYYQQLGEESPFASADAAYVLSFSTIMLNTDLHNPQIVASKRMTKDEFVRNNRGINDGNDLPKEYLVSLYDEIKAKQIQVDIDISDPKANTHVDVTDPTVWNKLINRQQHSNPPSFTPASAARKHSLTRSALLHVAQSSALTLKRDSYLLTTYEEDMFFTMCKPIYEAVVKLWEQTLDDVWITRLLQGILQMLAACVKLNLNYLYCRMSRTMLVKACQWMAKSRSMTAKPFARTNILASRNSYEQWKGEGKHDLLLLASLPSEQLVFNNNMAEKLDYSEMSLIKGEVTLKLVLETALQTTSVLDSTSFVVLFFALLWCRSRGTLPMPLALLNAEYVVLENTTQALLKVRFPPSAALHRSLLRNELSDATLYYVLASTTAESNTAAEEVAKPEGSSLSNRATAASPYHTNIANTKSARYPDISTINRAGAGKDQTIQGSSGGWMSSIGSLLWSNTADNSSMPTHATDTKHTANSLPSTDAPLDKRVGRLEFVRCSKVAGFVSNAMIALDRQGYPMRPDDMALATALNHTDILCSLLQSEQSTASTEVSMEGLFIVLKCLLRKHIPTIPASSIEGWLGEMGQSPISRMLKATNTGNTQGEQELLTALGVEMPIEEIADCILQESSEVDIVLCLEWISKKMMIGWEKHNRKAFRILKWVLADEVDVILATCPCLVDRCVFFVYQGLLSSIQNKEQGSVWWSLVVHILHLPIDILSAQGGMMVAGVVSIVFSMHNIQWNKAVSSDNWYNLLSLVLLLLTEGPTDKLTYLDMRSMIWQMVIHIFTEDMLCTENFDIVKKVVFKLLNRYVMHSRKRRSENVYQDEHLALQAIKELTCVEYAWKLCLVAWSEPVYNGSIPAVSTGAMYSTPSKTRPPALLVTPPRSPKGRDVAANLFNTSPTVADANSNKTERKIISFPPPIPSHPPASKMVEPVKVKVMMDVMSMEEASKLLVETAAMLADLCYIESVRVIESCLFGIEQLVGIESAIRLSPETIMSLLEELVNRLPQNIVVYTGRQQNSLSYSEIVAICLRGCNIIFTIFTRYTRVLVSLPHYSSLYIRAVSALVTNASVSPRLQPTHEEMMAMAVALLKLLRIPSQSQVDMRVAAERKSGTDLSTSPDIKPNAAVQASGGFSLWGLLGFSAPSSPLPNTSVAHIPTQLVHPASTSKQQQILQSSSVVAVQASAHDQELVCLAWKTASSLYSLFPGLVKSKEPQLHAAIMHCVDNPVVENVGFQSPGVKTVHHANIYAQSGTSTPIQTQTSGVKSAKKPYASPAVAQNSNRSASKVQIV